MSDVKTCSLLTHDQVIYAYFQWHSLSVAPAFRESGESKAPSTVRYCTVLYWCDGR